MSFAPFPGRTTSKTQPLFLLAPLFWGYLNSQIRINRMINSLDYHSCLQDYPLGYILSYFYILPRALSLCRMLVEFSLKLLHSTMFGKIFKFLAFTFLENAFIRGIFTYASPIQNSLPSSEVPRQKEITHSPRQHCLENLFNSTAERGWENYDLLY